MTTQEKRVIYNTLANRNNWFHTLWRALIPALGVLELLELQRAVENISATLEIISNATTDAHGWIQTEIEQVSQIALENRLALDGLLAAQGGVCAVINYSCCVYVNEKKQIKTDINQIWQASHLFHQIFQDATLGSGPDFSWLWLWLPGFGWLRQLFLIIIIITVAIVVIRSCVLWCTPTCLNSYSTLFSKRTPHQVMIVKQDTGNWVFLQINRNGQELCSENYEA